MDSNSRIPNNLIGAAGVHYVASELSRRGMIALPTIRNTAAFDIIVASRDGKRHANIQVKTSGRWRHFWRMPPSEKICCGRNDYYALVRWNPKQQRFNVLFTTGKNARDAVIESEKFQLKRISKGTRKAVVPSIYIGRKRKERGEQWTAFWESWQF